jgi:cation:H+ antiporter
VAGAVFIAQAFGVSDVVIGLTVIALGTSLPELATSVVAAIKRHTDLAVGNVIGSNVFNLLGILGIAATVAPLELVSVELGDWLIMLGVSLLILPLARTHFALRRWEGVLLLVVYGTYIGYVAWRMGLPVAPG